MNAKANLLRNKDLVKWWVSVSKDDRFADIVTHARAIIAESTPTQEQLRGAESLIATLETMTDNEPEESFYPSPGLHHQIESAKRKE